MQGKGKVASSRAQTCISCSPGKHLNLKCRFKPCSTLLYLFLAYGHSKRKLNFLNNHICERINVVVKCKEIFSLIFKTFKAFAKANMWVKQEILK